MKPDRHPFALQLLDPDFDILPWRVLKRNDADAIIVRFYPIQRPPRKVSIIHGALCYVPMTYLHHYVDLQGTFLEYLKMLSPKTRATLQRKVRKLQQDGLEFRVFRTADELACFHPLARQVAAKTYQERLLKTGLPDTPLFRAELRSRGEQGTARAFLLVKCGVPIAYLYSPEDAGVLMYEYLGYDPAFADCSPGTVLQYLALETMFAEGGRFRRFDFEEGDGQHKKIFATRSDPCCDLLIFRLGAKSCAAVIGHWALLSGTRFGSRAMKCLGLFPKFKSFLRRFGT